MKASIIITAYNQYTSICRIIRALVFQTIPSQEFEIIVVDDGSVDELSRVDSLDHIVANLNLTLIHQANLGRALARDAGIRQAKNEILVFCDGDRIPDNCFVEQHLNSHLLGQNIVVGAPYDYFGNVTTFDRDYIDWELVRHKSRLPGYFRKIAQIYKNGQTKSPLAWLSFMVGNSSIKHDLYYAAGGFNSCFKEWGFEHFELGLRLQQLNPTFCMNKNAKSFHCPHSRDSGFYTDAIEANIKLLKMYHPEINISAFIDIITTSSCPTIHEKDIFIKENDN